MGLSGIIPFQTTPLTGLAEWLAAHPNSPFERPPKLLAEFFTKRRFPPFGCTIDLIKRGVRVTDMNSECERVQIFFGWCVFCRSVDDKRECTASFAVGREPVGAKCRCRGVGCTRASRGGNGKTVGGGDCTDAVQNRAVAGDEFDGLHVDCCGDNFCHRAIQHMEHERNAIGRAKCDGDGY